MKNKFINTIIKKINNIKPIDDIEVIRFSLEIIYISVTKLIILIILAILLNIFLESMLLLVVFNILRFTAFGKHANSSAKCLSISLFVFLVFPFIAKWVFFPLFIKSILCIFAIIFMFYMSPYKKREIRSEKYKKTYKFITTCNCIILSFICVFIGNELISNIIIFGIYLELISLIEFKGRTK